eukprot:4227788-Pleurochrysis_carterae.AAC.1
MLGQSARSNRSGALPEAEERRYSLDVQIYTVFTIASLSFTHSLQHPYGVAAEILQLSIHELLTLTLHSLRIVLSEVWRPLWTEVELRCAVFISEATSRSSALERELAAATTAATAAATEAAAKVAAVEAAAAARAAEAECVAAEAAATLHAQLDSVRRACGEARLEAKAARRAEEDARANVQLTLEQVQMRG